MTKEVERIEPTRPRKGTKLRKEKINEFFLDSGAHSIYNQMIGHHGSITPEIAAHMQSMTAMERHAVRKQMPNVFRSKKAASYAYYESDEFWTYVDTYCQFIIDYQHAIDYYANVDVLFNPELSWKVLKYIEKEWGLNPVPVIHFNTDVKWVDKHLDAGYDYIGIGGLGQEITKQGYYEWADPVFERLCDPKTHLPRVRTHGFAMTAHELLVRYPWYCMTEEDHQVMTRSGWSSYSDLSVGDEILAYDEGELRWEPVLDIPSWEVKNIDITHMQGRSFEAHVTHNHNWPVIHARKERTSSKRFKKTCELGSSDCIPRCGKMKQFPQEKTYSNAFVELAAWYFTEGSIKKRPKYKDDSVLIYQSEKTNPKKCERIRQALQKAKEAYCEGTPTKRDGTIAFELYGNVAAKLLSEFPDKEIPVEFISKLTKGQLKRFVYISVIADGHARNGEAALLQKHGKNVDVFELACLLLGMTVSHQHVEKHHMKGVRVSRQDQSKKTWVGSLNMTEYKYSGRIWCVQVPSKAFVTKCGNHVYMTGNSVDSASWTKAGAFGRIYVPRQKGGTYNFLTPPFTLNVSCESPTTKTKGRNIATLTKQERLHVKRWLRINNVPYGKNDADGKTIKQGIINHHGWRKIANLCFYEAMLDSLPDWPWPFYAKTRQQRGFH